ncbi:hypothetical protein halTADL_1449 [Halohasta litchfieldiae]|uniref:Uncharacterized protein n=1 Tax=Halohasta litchfieldiae TaxID=1073996 RepID=A0A1H6Y513_9EURY|nr:hypothetical protein halTADL_1449 [Halohasta litchfieldiae]SEJ32220.1 hypothetical protein SAMN05444271_1475 [Halohasta litchfieldiae]
MTNAFHNIRIFEQSVSGKGPFLVAAASPSTLDDIQKRLVVEQLANTIYFYWIESGVKGASTLSESNSVCRVLDWIG